MPEISYRLKSARLRNERTVWLREPARPEKPFHLAVFLDGEFYRERVEAPAILDELESSGGIANTLAVLVSYESLEARWIECPCYPPFAEFVTRELLPSIAERYPAAQTSAERVLIGLSYTGLAAAYVAWREPGHFTRIIAQSGSFWSNDAWLAEQLRKLPEKLSAAFFLDVGTKETQVDVKHKEDVIQTISQIEGVHRFRDALRATGHEVKYAEFEGGHDFSDWKQTLPGALTWALAPH